MLFFFYSYWFSKESLYYFIQSQSSHFLLVYVILSLVRGIFLLPSTPFVLAGILLFPSQSFLVFFISITGIVITATYLYFASLFLEFDKLFGKNHSKKSDKIIEKLNQHGFWIVLGWAFFLLAPTDLICYIARSIKMNFTKYILAIFLGEAILIGTYVYFGKSIWGLV